MENASKALIIAGAILVSIMIISLGVFVFNRFGGQAKESVEGRMTEQEISSFNSRITPYLGQSISGSQVNALIQYVISNDLNCIKTGETYKAITITFPSGGGTNTIKVNGTNLDGTSVKRVETGSGKYYSVNGTYNDGLITQITVVPK